jgi:hypothetical protein
MLNKSNRNGGKGEGNGNGDRLINGIFFNYPNEHSISGYDFLSPQKFKKYRFNSPDKE